MRSSTYATQNVRRARKKSCDRAKCKSWKHYGVIEAGIGGGVFAEVFQDTARVTQQ